jgi:hypothetical protein
LYTVLYSYIYVEGGEEMLGELFAIYLLDKENVGGWEKERERGDK